MSTSTENIPRAAESGARASDDLLEIARATGLRQYMHGVNATDARFILQRFVGALRFLHADSDAPAAGRTVPEAIRTMAQRIAADKFEHCTADPIFTVQKRKLLSGLDLDYCDDIGWFYDGDQLLGEEAVTLEAEYQDSGRVPDNHTRTGIMETWEHHASYITQESAQEFVAKKGDQYRVYVDSGCRNHEWKALRAFLEDVAAAPTPLTSAADALPVDWQLIATAPKGGRTLLLGYYNRAGKWRTVRGQWMSEAYIAENWEDLEDGKPGWFETSVEADDPPNCWAIDPTHWMPIPAAPTQDIGATDALADPSA